MAIQMTHEDVVAANLALQQLAQMTLPIKTAMQVRRVLRVVQPVAADVQAERQKLIEQYAVKVAGKPEVDDRGFVNFGDQKEAYVAAHRELMGLEAEIDAPLLHASTLELEEVQPALLVDLGDLLVDDLG